MKHLKNFNESKWGEDFKNLGNFDYSDDIKKDEILDDNFEKCLKELGNEFLTLIQKYEKKYPNVMEYKDDVFEHLQSLLLGDNF